LPSRSESSWTSLLLTTATGRNGTKAGRSNSFHFGIKFRATSAHRALDSD
jgi:hypothetical protein